MNILLAYVSYPVTTAVYFERSLRKIANVKTIGPSLPTNLITQWKLENLKEKIKPHDVPVDMTVDLSKIINELNAFKPDLYLWIESVPGYFPANLQALQCKKACYLIDTYISHEWHKKWAKNFDYVFLADLSYVAAFRAEGINAYWLPLACDQEIHSQPSAKKTHEISFVGSVFDGTDRKRYLDAIATRFPLYYERSFLREMANTFASSKIVFNNAVGKTDLNMRCFEAMASGALLLTDMANNSGQDILFEPHYEYALYNEKNILDIVAFYLKDDLAREETAKHGQQLVLAGHQYIDRVENMLQVINGEQKNTMNPYELRDYAHAKLKNQKQKSIKIENHLEISRSFIIPVLDYSPASQFNIKTLLHDLENISGDVIVIFNNLELAKDLKDHPRINHYAILNANVGVARAWNIGLEMCTTDDAFILNADLHILKDAVEQLQQALHSLPKAAIVGPQGGYFDFEKKKDILYLTKGAFSNPMEVDNVSGFLFAINRRLFKLNNIQFEDAYTPCYFEEWDIGYQIKRAGLKAYIVPVAGYEHEWSGSIRSYRQIQYFDRKQTAEQIRLRNEYLFDQKWRLIAKEKNQPEILESLWLKILAVQFEIALKKNMPDVAKDFINQLEKYFPGHHYIQKCKELLAQNMK